VISCSRLAGPGHDFSEVPDAPTVILSASEASGGGGPLCNVYGYIAPQEQFLLSLPATNYAGVYLQQGCGSFCGIQIADPAATGGTGAGAKHSSTSCANLAWDPQSDLVAGAPATGFDDQGHTGGDGDALWAEEDPALRVSFGYTSEHALAQAARAIIAAYYGKPPRYSFFDGCSGGGREALVEAQRYPRDFNGILAGAPGQHRGRASR
jgi:feruloyl esterase